MRSFEFQRGKGLYIDWQQECIACYGKLASYQPTFKRGPRKLTMRRGTGPLKHNQAPGLNKWHIYLQMRHRIGHGHFKGIVKKKVRW